MEYQRIGVVTASGPKRPGNGRRDAASHGARRHHLHEHHDRKDQCDAGKSVRAEFADK